MITHAEPPRLDNAAAGLGEWDPLAGISRPIRALRCHLAQVADGGTSILIEGASPIGTSAMARSVWQHGPRRGGPFIMLDGGKVPRDVLERHVLATLCRGHAGALLDHPGLLHAARGGILFVCDAGDIPLRLQAALARAASDPSVDIVLIVARHNESNGPDDTLHPELSQVLGPPALRLPPLHERLSDIVPLAEEVLLRLTGRASRKRLSGPAAARLLSYGWPGDVGELRRAVERAAASARETLLQPQDFAFLRNSEDGSDLPSSVERLEIEMIQAALEVSGGRRAVAARRLGIHRQLLYGKLRRYGLEHIGRGRSGGSRDGEEA